MRFTGKFGFGISDTGFDELWRKRYEAIIIADHQIPWCNTAPADHDGQIDSAKVSASRATRGDPSRKDRKVVPTAKCARIPHGTVTDHAGDAFTPQMTRENVADHGRVTVPPGVDYQNLTLLDHIERVQDGAEIWGFAAQGDSLPEQPGLPTCGAKRADRRINLACVPA